jgi:hypothetical protein
MDATQLDDLIIAIPCPNCSGETSKSFTWIQDNRKLWCAMCHVEIDLSGHDTRHAVGDIKRAIKEVKRAVLDFQLSIKGPVTGREAN